MRAFIDELSAKTTAKILSGDKDQYAENHTLAGNMIHALEKIGGWFSRLTSKEAKAEYNRVNRVKNLFLSALAEKGYTYQNGKVVSASKPEEKENTAEAVENDGSVRFSRNVSFSEQIDQLLDGTFNSENTHIMVDNHTPSIFLQAGLFDKPILIAANKAKAAMGIEVKGRNLHEVSAETLK